MNNVITNNHCVQYIATTHKVIVKNVTNTTAIMVIRLSLGFSKQTILAKGDKAWDDYQISKVQSRSQL